MGWAINQEVGVQQHNDSGQVIHSSVPHQKLGIRRHSKQCPTSVVSQHKLVSGWGMQRQRSAQSWQPARVAWNGLCSLGCCRLSKDILQCFYFMVYLTVSKSSTSFWNRNARLHNEEKCLVYITYNFAEINSGNMQRNILYTFFQSRWNLVCYLLKHGKWTGSWCGIKL